MRKKERKVIAISEETGERKEFSGVNSAARAIGVAHPQVLIALAMGQAVKGWRVYDEPSRIRENIALLEAQLQMLEG